MAVTAKEIAEEVVKILKEDRDFKIQKNLTPFQKTEKLLYNLKYLKGAIDVKRKRLSGLQNDPVLLSKKEIGETSKKIKNIYQKWKNWRI